jgi:DNA-binding GntR family transcriptional regulator
MPPSAARPALRSVRPKADPLPAPDRLRWRAYESFRQHLLASRIRPGQFISQRELAALTGLPLGAIREVIPRLEAEGLLVTVPQRGLQIANVDVKLIHNAFLLRLILEREAAAQFAHTVSDDELDQLEAAHRDILARARRRITPVLLNAARAVDWGLHDAMIDAMGNELISAVYRTNMLRIRLIRLERVVPDPIVLVRSMEDHLALLAALRTRDPRLAVAALEAHLNHARSRALGA